MATRYALFLHADSEVRLVAIKGSRHGFGLFTRSARRQGELIVFVTGQISTGAGRGGKAYKYDDTMPRDEQPLRQLLGPIRFAWAACIPNCKVSLIPTNAFGTLTPRARSS